MTDYRLATPPAFPDDITYCSRDCAAECFRHADHIDWELPGHKYYGASLSDFSPVCASYRESPLQKLVSYLYDRHVRADLDIEELAEEILGTLEGEENHDDHEA